MRGLGGREEGEAEDGREQGGSRAVERRGFARCALGEERGGGEEEGRKVEGEERVAGSGAEGREREVVVR